MWEINLKDGRVPYVKVDDDFLPLATMVAEALNLSSLVELDPGTEPSKRLIKIKTAQQKADVWVRIRDLEFSGDSVEFLKDMKWRFRSSVIEQMNFPWYFAHSSTEGSQ